MRVGCRSRSGVMHGSLGRTVTCHDERHEYTGETERRHHPRRQC